MMRWKPIETKHQGRSRIRWIDVIKRDFENYDLEIEEISELAKNRKDWKKLVQALCIEKYERNK